MNEVRWTEKPEDLAAGKCVCDMVGDATFPILASRVTGKTRSHHYHNTLKPRAPVTVHEVVYFASDVPNGGSIADVSAETIQLHLHASCFGDLDTPEACDARTAWEASEARLAAMSRDAVATVAPTLPRLVSTRPVLHKAAFNAGPRIASVQTIETAAGLVEVDIWTEGGRVVCVGEPRKVTA